MISKYLQQSAQTGAACDIMKPKMQKQRGIKMSIQYIAKTQAVIDIMQRTGYGRYVIERKMNELVGSNTIRFVDDPADIRKKLISKEDVEAVIHALTTI